ncbi:MAG: prohibitin family protein [Rhodocyclaceae bacterium]|nr:prohibitin family protein [Rhodocyclaceae bacterium]MBX3671120.1 prohibitin family protein [Rhodocyclaceae bacterium]
MLQKLNQIAAAIRNAFARRPQTEAGDTEIAPAPAAARQPITFNPRLLALLLGGAVIAAAGYQFVRHPPMQTVGAGELGVRINTLDGSLSEWREGNVLVLPGLHAFSTFSLRDRNYRPSEIASADGPAPLQSSEGLSLGVDLSVRYALDPARIAQNATSLPPNLETGVVQPALQSVIYKVFSRYTVKEIFSTKRADIQQAVEAELKSRLATDGILLRSVLIGKVDLPREYKRSMEDMLAEEMATQKLQYTLELKAKRVRETELEAEADRVRRETAAAAQANEQVIAAKAQEEAMKHVLPFKQRQIEQRQLEAEAEKVARIKNAEAAAAARRIEAQGEAEARQKLADAEVYRAERMAKVSTDQMEREGAALMRHPLLVERTLAEKLSDKIQVIVAPPSTDGRIISAALLHGNGGMPAARTSLPAAEPADAPEER